MTRVVHFRDFLEGSGECCTLRRLGVEGRHCAMTPAQIMQLERLGLLRVRPRRSRARPASPVEASLGPPSQIPAALKVVPRPPLLAVTQGPAALLKRPTRSTSYW